MHISRKEKKRFSFSAIIGKTVNPANSRRKLLGCLSLLFFPLFCLVTMDYFNFKGLNPSARGFVSLQEHIANFPMQTLFEVIVIYLLFVLIWALVRYAWVAVGIVGVLSLVCSFVQYMKLTLNGDPFVPMDLALTGQATELASFVSVPIPWLFWPALVVTVAWTVLLFFSKATFPFRWFIRIPGVTVVCVAVVLLFPSSGREESILLKFNMSIMDSALQTSNYTANGFVGAFTVNVLSLQVEKPEGYSQETVTELLGDYSFQESDEDYQDYDVIVILAESFFDLRELEGVTYSEELLTNYDEILASENCYSGTLYTNALGGGTVRPEFEILTGLTTDILPFSATPYVYINSDVESYVSNYKSAGYNTLAIHLYDSSFYNRNSSYPYLGFDAFYGLDDVLEDGAVEITYTRGRATDASTEAAIEYYLDQAGENGNPTFLFAITIANHQPYGESEDNTVTVTADALDETCLQALTTYAQGIKDADEMLGALKEYIDNRDRPTVLVWFGDHLPTLGVTNTPYEALGYYDSSDLSTENRMKVYSTPFFIYSNTELEQGLLTSKSDNQISTYCLLEYVAACTGFQQTSYMRLLADMQEVLPYYSSRLNMDSSLTEEQSAYLEAQKVITYDRLVGKGYSQ